MHVWIFILIGVYLTDLLENTSILLSVINTDAVSNRKNTVVAFNEDNAVWADIDSII